MDIPVVPDKVSNSVGNQSSAGHASKKHVIDIDCDEDDNAVSLDSILLKEVNHEFSNRYLIFSNLLLLNLPFCLNKFKGALFRS